MVYISVAMVLLIIFDVILYVYREKNRQMKMENKILKMQLEQEQDIYHKMNDIYEESRIMRHDLKHYLSIILGLILNKEYLQAQKFIVEIIGRSTAGDMVIYQGSKVVNAVLNDKYDACRSGGIDFRISVNGTIPDNYELDIAIILANLLDNAIEAQSNFNDGVIRLNMQEDKGMLYLLIENKTCMPVLRSNPHMSTTKKYGKYHGLGLSSVRRLLAKMDGTFQQYEEQGYFITYITIPMGK